MYSLCLFFSPSIIILRFTYVFVCVNNSLLFIAEKISLYECSAIYLSMYLLLIFRLLPFGASNNQIAMGICVQFFVQKYISISLG